MLNKILSEILGWVTTVGLKLIIALIVLFISFGIINRLARKIEKSTDNGKFDKTLTNVLAYILKIGLKILIVIAMVGFVGIDTSGITALIASLGVCVGLAVNGALSNLAGGVLIILTRPFKVDDFIEAQGYSGTVEDIRMTYTRLCTPDNKVVYVPNGALSAGTIVNYSDKDVRRVDLAFKVDYSTDVEKAKSLITKVVNAHELVSKDPAPFVRVTEHGDSAITITVRVWAKGSDYWTVHLDLLEDIKSIFDAAEITVPFNQLDVHIKND